MPPVVKECVIKFLGVFLELVALSGGNGERVFGQQLSVKLVDMFRALSVSTGSISLSAGKCAFLHKRRFVFEYLLFANHCGCVLTE